MLWFFMTVWVLETEIASLLFKNTLLKIVAHLPQCLLLMKYEEVLMVSYYKGLMSAHEHNAIHRLSVGTGSRPYTFQCPLRADCLRITSCVSYHLKKMRWFSHKGIGQGLPQPLEHIMLLKWMMIQQHSDYCCFVFSYQAFAGAQYRHFGSYFMTAASLGRFIRDPLTPLHPLSCNPSFPALQKMMAINFINLIGHAVMDGTGEKWAAGHPEVMSREMGCMDFFTLNSFSS